MNRKGQVAIYGLMLGLTIFILALALAPAGNQFIGSAMNTTWTDSNNVTSVGLDCTNSSISNFDKATCVVTDFSLPYFFGGLLFIAGAIITARIIFT